MGQTAAIAVSEENQREIGILFVKPIVEEQQILHSIHSRFSDTVAGAVVSPSVGTMIVRKGNISVGIEESGEVIITAAVFTQTMANLDNTFGVRNMIPELCVNLFSVE
jgi:hypothetical protein